MRAAATLAIALGVFLAGLAPAVGQDREARPASVGVDPEEGRRVYEERCAACHGMDGDGQGLAAPLLFPPPRDFTGFTYKIRSTATGELPRDEDLYRSVTLGLPGTTMPGWSRLTVAERWHVVDYLKTFAAEDFAEGLPEDALVEVPADVGVADAETLARGARLYEVLQCWECHGESGKGNGPSAHTLQDEFGNPMGPTDLTRTDLYRGGREVRDIARAYLTGLGTTPMPSYADYFRVFQAREDLPEDQQILRVDEDTNALALAHFVLSLAAQEERGPAALEVVARHRPGGVPEHLDAEAWAQVPRNRLELSSQLTVVPRWQFAVVDEVFVRAVHDGRTLALRLEWSDRVENREHAEEPEAPPPDPERPVLLPTLEELKERRLLGFADAVSVLVPTAPTDGMRKPFFAMGSPDAPVEEWSFRADRGGLRARRTGFQDPPAETADLSCEARYAEGRWSVLFLVPVAGDARFRPGRFVPMAVAAWDGGNGEQGSRCALSTWTWLVLEPVPTATPWLVSGATLVLVGLLELWWIRRVRRREPASHPPLRPSSLPLGEPGS